MKKKVILIVLFLFCGLILCGSVFSRTEENNVKDIVLEDNKLDLSYYEEKYDIYNEKKTCFEITENYQSNTKVLGKNSNSNEVEVRFCLYVNKEEQYFLFSYEAIVDEEVVLTSKVKIDLVEYNEKYYLVSSNGCVTPYDEVYQELGIKDCALCYAYFDDCIGITGLGERGLLGGGGGGCAAAIGGALGLAGVAALASSSNKGGGSLSVPHASGGSGVGKVRPNFITNKDETPEGKNVKEKVNDLLKDAKPGRETKGKTDQYEKDGGFDQAKKDYDHLNPENSKEIDTAYGKGHTGVLEDGSKVNVRPGSTQGEPTLEIQFPNGKTIKIRYGE